MPISVGTIGLVFRATVKDETGAVMDLSDAESLTFAFRKPLTTSAMEREAEPTGDGSDGQIQYTTEAGDLDRAGPWSVQGFARMNDGSYWPTSVHHFRVD